MEALLAERMGLQYWTVRKGLDVGCELVGLGCLQYRSCLWTTPFVHASTEVSGVLLLVMVIGSQQNVALCELEMSTRWVELEPY